MKTTFLQKLAIGFSAIGLFSYTVIYACAGGDWDFWDDNSNFAPEVFVEKSYSPLFLSPDVFYTRDYYGFDTAHNSRFNDEIISDWSNYLDKKIDLETLKFFLTVDSSATELAGISKFISTKKPTDFSKKWESKIDYKDKKIKNFIEFLDAAKKLEDASTNESYWDYDSNANQKTVDGMLISLFEKRYNSEKDSFLKNRYWFQTIKALFYQGDYEKTVAFFNKTQNDVPKNTLYYRALSYLAGINYKNKNYALSNYQYSIVFDKCPTMRVVTAYCFHPQEETDWNQSLAMAKTNEEKAALWALQGYYNDEVRAIENIYDLKPESEHLDYLLTRLVNIQEGKIDNSFENKTIEEKKKTNKEALNATAIALVDKIAKTGKTSKPYLWNCAAGYLQTLTQNYSQAESYFDKAEKQLPKNNLAINQLRLLRFINNVSKTDKINAKSEVLLVPDLKWIYQELKYDTAGELRYNNASAWSKRYLSALYKSQKNTVMAELFDRNNDFYDNQANLEAMKTFMSKENKSEIEKIAANVYNVKLTEIYEYEAVKATFQNKITEAIAFMQKTDSIQHSQFLGNPFNGNIKDCHDCDHAAYQKRKYSEIEFLTILKEMQDKIAKQEDVYTNAMLTANAFYNITHFGNARSFHEGTIMGYGSSPYDFRDSSKKMVSDCSLAKLYYEKALAAAKTDEQKAKCQYMLAKCERNDYYNKKYYTTYTNWYEQEETEVNFLAWNGFKNLKKSYFNTKYYQEVIRECGYFDTYINGPKN